MKLILTSLGILFGSLLMATAEVPHKKFIEVGWDMPDTAFLREHWQEMERTAPFDGLKFYVAVKKPDGGRADSLKIWDGKPWERVWFTNCIADLKTCQFTNLDMYLNPPGHQYYFPPLDGSRLKRLQRNLAAARDAADEYVWLYGEQCNWWGNWELDAWFREQVKKTAGQGHRWEVVLPGITRVIRAVRDPEGAARDFVVQGRAAGTLTNLASNGDFTTASADKAHPAEWNTWQDEGSTGRFAFDAGAGSAQATRVKNGCFLQSHPVHPGETFVIEAQCRAAGASVPGLMIRWQRADGSWVRWDADATFTFSGSCDGWAQAFGVVTVPDNAGKLVILLKAEHQMSDADVCWFDNVELYRLVEAR